MKRAIAMGAALVCAAGVAHADSRAWAAAKQAFPAHLGWVGGARLDGADTRKAIKSAITAFVTARPDDAKLLLAVKRVCGVELQDAVDSIVAGSPTGDPDDAAVVIALHGLDRAGFEGCVQGLAKDMGGAITIKTSGAFTMYDDGGDALTVRWLGKDVFAIAIDTDKPAKLLRMTAGGLATDKATLALVARANPDATMWGAGAISSHDDHDGVDVAFTQELGHVDLAGDQVSGEVRLVTTDAKVATRAADKDNAELRELAHGRDVPPLLQNAAIAVRARADGRELVYTGKLHVSELVQLATMLVEK